MECTTEPFDLDEPPEHALVAREVLGAAALDAVDVGPFGNTAQGSAEAVVEAVAELLRRTLAAGATRVSLQVNVLGEAGRAPAAGQDATPGEAPGDIPGPARSGEDPR
nr:hypothetical protein [Streptomyces sp. SID4948]